MTTHTDDGGNVTYDPDDGDAYKFWQVEVDHYGPKTFAQGSTGHAVVTDLSNIDQSSATANTQSYKSYLRLGTSNVANTASNVGYDLSQFVQSFYDDTRWTDTDGAATNQLSPAARVNESAILHYKGGWRSHTEGNRVDTTRGDKVEVVRGNYQMVVLGRQDADANKSRYEASGGHFSRDNDNMTPGAIYEIKYHLHGTYGATWTTIEETTRGNHISRYHGDILEEYYGEKMESYIGDETGGNIGSGTRSSASGDDGNAQNRLSWIAASGDAKINPVITEKVWGKSLLMSEKYGSTAGAWGVKYKLTQGDGGTVEEWVGKYREDWDATNKTWDSSLYNISSYTESVSADNMKMTSKATGLGGVINEVAIASGAITDTRLAAGTITDTALSTTRFDFQIHGTRLGFTFSLLNVEALVAPILTLDMKTSANIIDLQLAAIKVDVYKALRVKESQFNVENGVATLTTTALYAIT